MHVLSTEIKMDERLLVCFLYLDIFVFLIVFLFVRLFFSTYTPLSSTYFSCLFASFSFEQINICLTSFESTTSII